MTGLWLSDNAGSKYYSQTQGWGMLSGIDTITQLVTALKAGSANIAFVGDSITFGANQNALINSMWRVVQDQFIKAFPNKTLTFYNYGIGGKRSGDFFNTLASIGWFPAAQSGNYMTQYWRGVSLNTAQTWEWNVAQGGHDCIIYGFSGLNENDLQSYATNLDSFITRIQGNALWATKRPSIIFITTHGNAQTPDVIRLGQRVMRAKAYQYGIPIIDGAAHYDLATIGVDPTARGAGSVEFIGEDPLHRNGTDFLATLYDMPLAPVATNTATSAFYFNSKTGSSNPWRLIRKQATMDGTVHGQFSLNNTSVSGILTYRENNSDNNYINGTAQCYAVTIGNTTVQAQYRASGGTFTNIAGASITLSNAMSSNVQMEVRYNHGRHEVIVNGVSGETKSMVFYDYKYIGGGYSGIGSLSNPSVAAVCSANNICNSGTWFEYQTPVVKNTYYTNMTEMFGASNDWASNPQSVGGNTINHMTNQPYAIVYEKPAIDIVKKLQLLVGI